MQFPTEYNRDEKRQAAVLYFTEKDNPRINYLSEVSHFFISAEPNQCTGVDCPDADGAEQRRGHYLKLLLNQIVRRCGRILQPIEIATNIKFQTLAINH